MFKCLYQKRLRRALDNVGFIIYFSFHLSLFFVDLEPSLINSNVLKINSLCYTKIKIEASKPKNKPPQYMNCQDYDHKKSYCNSKPRCVHCGDFHTSISYQKSCDLLAKWTLCFSNHLENYKGWPTYKNHRIEQTNSSLSKNPIKYWRNHKSKNSFRIKPSIYRYLSL